MQNKSTKLFLTGASGLLGRAVFKTFIENGWDVYGTALTRVGTDLHKLDVTDYAELEKALKAFKPDFVIHCAAQRFPDKVSSNPIAAELLNVDSTKRLAEFSAELSIPMLYISTDYVFDGSAPPYHIEDKPNPLNLYGKTKLRGEQVTLGCNTGNIVLRIPVLYGPVESLSESSVTVLLNNLLNSSQPCKVNNYEKRYPSHVDDIAHICFQLASNRLQGEPVSGVYHWCGREMFTKYGMVLVMAQVLGLPDIHVNSDSDPPGLDTTSRPVDVQLHTLRLDQLGIGKHTPFRNGIRSTLQLWVKVKDE